MDDTALPKATKVQNNNNIHNLGPFRQQQLSSLPTALTHLDPTAFVRPSLRQLG
jgi:hypothetical protein